MSGGSRIRWRCGRWKLLQTSIAMVLEQLAVCNGCLALATAVLYYLGNFPDVFPIFDLLLCVFAGFVPLSSLVCFLLHGPIDY